MSTMHATNWLGQVTGDGRYRILGLLGEGNMGRVYRARDLRLENDVCIKVPRTARWDDQEFRSRFSHEIRSLVRLSHPHVVKILDVGEFEGAPFCVMQYLAGGSLRDRQRPHPAGFYHPMPPDFLREWLLPIAKALDFVHGQQYVHRDVKPANILFDHAGNAFISDFGLAKVLAVESDNNHEAGLTQAGHVVGTPYYIAPEVVMGTGCDGRADQYSLAVAVHEILCGRPLFDGNTSSAIVVHHIKTPPTPLAALVPGIPRSLSDAVLQALAKEPAARFETCQAFAEAVLATTSTATVSASRPPGLVANPQVSRGKHGQIPCPNCKKALVVRPEFAGKRARCGHCGSRSIISADGTMLTLVATGPQHSTQSASNTPPRPPSPGQTPSSRDGNTIGAAANGYRSRLDMVFEEMDFSPPSATPAPRKSGVDTLRTRLPETIHDEVVLEEQVFGFRVSKQSFAIISAIVLALALGTAGLVGYVVSHADRDPADSVTPVNVGRDTD